MPALTIDDMVSDINLQCEQSRLFHAAALIKTTLSLWQKEENFNQLHEDAQIMASLCLQAYQTKKEE